MSFQEPTYEDFKKATAFARFRYKYGLIVTFLCWLSLVYIAYLIIANGEKIASDPLQYACNSMDIECHCYRTSTLTNPYGVKIDFYANATNKWILQTQSEKRTITSEELDKIFKNLTSK